MNCKISDCSQNYRFTLTLLANSLGLNSGEVSYISYTIAQLQGALNCDNDSLQWNAKEHVVQMETCEGISISFHRIIT